MARSSGIFLKDLVFYLIVICIVSTEAITSNLLKVQFQHGGVLVGRHLSSNNGRNIRAFLGIPYAKPPVGELRFRSPVPFGSWEGERLATKDGNVCLQISISFRQTEMIGSEDCLYLNVFTPEDVSEPLPVMVWIHGGGFKSGSGSSNRNSPEYLLDRNIILVTLNYRLDALGFLSTETLDCPGNFGLKDQQLALKWVHANIANFGGNPNSVTIFGISSGGASVAYHALSQNSKGLFYRAILQSGTFFNFWAAPLKAGHPAKQARKVANNLGCDSLLSEGWANVVECLRSKPAEELLVLVSDFYEWEKQPLLKYAPVVEPEHEEAFLSKPAEVTVQSSSVPIVIGFTSDEGLIQTVPLLNNTDFKTNVNNILPLMLRYNHLSAEVQTKITSELINMYFSDGFIFDWQNFRNLTNMFTDLKFKNGILNYINQRVILQPNSTTYVYRFDHKGYASYSEVLGATEEYMGSSHVDDLFYLFPLADLLLPTAFPSKRDQELREIMVDLWVNFATTGIPNTVNADMPKWTPYPPQFMHIGSRKADEPLLRLDDKLIENNKLIYSFN